VTAANVLGDPRWRAASLAARGLLAGIVAHAHATGHALPDARLCDLAPYPIARRLVRELLGLGLVVSIGDGYAPAPLAPPGSPAASSPASPPIAATSSGSDDLLDERSDAYRALRRSVDERGRS